MRGLDGGQNTTYKIQNVNCKTRQVSSCFLDLLQTVRRQCCLILANGEQTRVVCEVDGKSPHLCQLPEQNTNAATKNYTTFEIQIQKVNLIHLFLKRSYGHKTKFHQLLYIKNNKSRCCRKQ